MANTCGEISPNRFQCLIKFCEQRILREAKCMICAQASNKEDRAFVVELLGVVPEYSGHLPRPVLELADTANSNLRQ